jgi:hypothetical protein
MINPNTIKGIWTLQGVDQVIKSLDDWNDSRVTGVSLRHSWNKVEPKRNVRSFTYFDTYMAKTTKPVMLRLVAGLRSPEWLGGTWVQGELYCPLPWGTVYLDRWTSTIAAFGAHYNNNPQVALIQMTGVGHSGEMWMDPGADWASYGYTSAKVISAWKRVIDTYVVAFPNKLLALDIAWSLGSDHTTLQPILDYCTSKYKGHVVFQQNGLKGDSPRIDVVFWSTLLTLAKAGNLVGWQTTGSQTFKTAEMADYQVAFQRGIDSGGRYFEIYTADVLSEDTKVQSALNWLYNTTKGL